MKKIYELAGKIVAVSFILILLLILLQIVLVPLLILLSVILIITGIRKYYLFKNLNREYK